MEKKERLEVVLIPGVIKKDFSIWEFVKRYLRLLLILLAAGVIIGAVIAVFYLRTPAKPSIPSDDIVNESPSLFPPEDMVFVESKLSEGGFGNIEIGYRVNEEITYIEYLFRKLLLANESDRSVLPYKIQQLQVMLDNSRKLIDGAKEDIIHYPALLVNDDIESIETFIDENRLVIEAYKEELSREAPSVNYIIANSDIKLGLPNYYAEMRIKLARLENVNAELEKIVRGTAISTIHSIESAAIQKSIDTSVMLVDDVKQEFYGIIRELEQKNATFTPAPVTPSKIMAAAIFMAVAVGVFGIGMIVLLILDSIRKVGAESSEQ